MLACRSLVHVRPRRTIRMPTGAHVCVKIGIKASHRRFRTRETGIFLGGHQMKRVLTSLFVACAIVAPASVANAQHATMSDADLTKLLVGAAPQHVLEGATILNMGADGKMKTVREGTNGWT